MEHLADFLKLIFEKGTWLAAVALAAVTLAVGRHYGYLPDIEASTVFFVYLAGAICGGVLLLGGLVTVGRSLASRFKKWMKRRKVRSSAVRNLTTLPPRYQIILIWLFTKEMQWISAEGDTSDLDTLADQGYLDREDNGNAYNVIRTYKVTDEIWSEIGKLDLSSVKGRLPKDPPWIRDWRV